MTMRSLLTSTLSLLLVLPGGAASAQKGSGLDLGDLKELARTKSVNGLVEQAESAVSLAALPIPKERALGKKLSKEVEKESKLHPSKEVQAYVAKVGAKVAKQARDTPRGISYTFKVIDDDETVNAFALPGGHIYVYSGLLKMASDESELAAVLGHEVAHVSQRHVANRLIAAHGLETLLGVAAGKNEQSLAGILGNLAGQGTMMAFGREQESDADAHGQPYAAAAGYDPHGFVRLFAKMAKGEGPGLLVWLQSHPMPSDRAERAEERIAKMKKKSGATNEEAYRRMLEKL